MTVTYTPEEVEKINNALFDIILDYHLKDEQMEELKKQENYRELVAEKGIQAFSSWNPIYFNLDYSVDDYYLRGLSRWIVQEIHKALPDVVAYAITIIKYIPGVLKKLGWAVIDDERWVDRTLYNFISAAEWRWAGASTSIWSKNE